MVAFCCTVTAFTTPEEGGSWSGQAVATTTAVDARGPPAPPSEDVTSPVADWERKDTQATEDAVVVAVQDLAAYSWIRAPGFSELAGISTCDGDRSVSTGAVLNVEVVRLVKFGLLAGADHRVPGMSDAAGFGHRSLQVVSRRAQPGRVIAEHADAVIAVAAEDATDPACRVVMVGVR